MNQNQNENLLSKLNQAEETIINPLKMHAKKIDGSEEDHLAINEISIFRQSKQTASLNIKVDHFPCFQLTFVKLAGQPFNHLKFLQADFIPLLLGIKALFHKIQFRWVKSSQPITCRAPAANSLDFEEI